MKHNENTQTNNSVKTQSIISAAKFGSRVTSPFTALIRSEMMAVGSDILKSAKKETGTVRSLII
jgi:hypothetical protein